MHYAMERGAWVLGILGIRYTFIITILLNYLQVSFIDSACHSTQVSAHRFLGPRLAVAPIVH